MEDAHAAVLNLYDKGKAGPTAGTAAGPGRLSFFGVYDGHGGDKVAIFTGLHLHEILAKQDAFKKQDYEQALKDAFLATDHAILSSQYR